MDWGWPQWVFATFYAISLISHSIKYGKGEIGEGVFAISLIGIVAGPYILHAGGFW